MSAQPTTATSPEETIRAAWPQEVPKPQQIEFSGDGHQTTLTVAMPNGATVATTRFHDHQDSDDDPNIGVEASGDWEAYVTLLAPWLLITNATRAGLAAHQGADSRPTEQESAR